VGFQAPLALGEQVMTAQQMKMWPLSSIAWGLNNFLSTTKNAADKLFNPPQTIVLPKPPVALDTIPEASEDPQPAPSLSVEPRGRWGICSGCYPKCLQSWVCPRRSTAWMTPWKLFLGSS